MGGLLIQSQSTRGEPGLIAPARLSLGGEVRGPGPRAPSFDPPLRKMEFNGKRIHFIDDLYRRRRCLTKSKVIFVNIKNVVSVLNKEDDKKVR